MRFQLRIDTGHFRALFSHLFPGDGDEHGAVILAGKAEGKGITRLLTREVVIARDGIDWVRGARGYRAFSAQFVAELSERCFREKLCYLSVHNHRGEDYVALSEDDLAAHQRGYPALLQITEGLPVGGLVFASNAAAGEIWTRAGVWPLECVTVIGPQMKKLTPRVDTRDAKRDQIYDRQSRVFGDRGQQLLRSLKVGVVGLGGAGSLISEWLARLGVGHIVAIDPDRIEPSNLPRVVGATRWDAMTLLTLSRWDFLRRFGRRIARPKVHIARRVARAANPDMIYDAVPQDVLNETTAKLLCDCDFVFWAADPIQTRLVLNGLVHQYLVPGVQVGAKVPVAIKTGKVGQIFTASRPVLPHQAGGCLECNGLIPASLLQQEASTDEEQRGQRYVDDPTVTAPSVITLNAVACSTAVNDFLLMFQGLFEDGIEMNYDMAFPRTREIAAVHPTFSPSCPDCSSQPLSRKGRGDLMSLPCRQA